MKPKRRIVALLLAVAMVVGMMPMAFAADQGEDSSGNVGFTKVDNSLVSEPLEPDYAEQAEEEALYAADDMVRVSIVLNGESTMDAGFATKAVGTSKAYRAILRAKQNVTAQSIRAAALKGRELDVVWNLTLAANMISANVRYGDIEAIKKVSGVADVFVEKRFESGEAEEEDAQRADASEMMIGADRVHSEGYYGAGGRIAVIDTGVDDTHPSLAEDAFEYALAQSAEEKGMSLDEYKQELKLLTEETVTKAWNALNIAKYLDDPAQSYHSEKLPFGVNYVDHTYDVSHKNDYEGDHGTFVAGVAAANRYVKVDGEYVDAMEKVWTQGVAPDAQILTMKVFGKNGGAFESDYVAAIEDAIVLGADAANISASTYAPGETMSEAYQSVMAALQNTIVTAAAGNEGAWNGGKVYSGDANFNMVGAPGSFTNTLTVASADNAGKVGFYFTIGEEKIFYDQRYYTIPLALPNGTFPYVYLKDAESYIDLPMGNCFVIVDRCDKALLKQMLQYLVSYGVRGIIVVNDRYGSFNINQTGIYSAIPVAYIDKVDGERIRALSEEDYDYYYGEITHNFDFGKDDTARSGYTMSYFSSWGVPDDLSIKPEIVAPGNDVYSLYSLNGEEDELEYYYNYRSGTSSAAPQIAGMTAVIAEAMREKNVVSNRALQQSLLMSTAVPMKDPNRGGWYSVLRQGAGLANVDRAIHANSYILMGKDATPSAADGKVKVELGDDPNRTGKYHFTFTVHNMTDEAQQYRAYTNFFTQAFKEEKGERLLDEAVAALGASVLWNVNGDLVESATDLSNMDFNADGTVNTLDAIAILEYVVGNREKLNCAELADFDCDGAITSRDAYEFLQELGTGILYVPANDSITVGVDVDLVNAADFDDNGAFVEGYVFLDNLNENEAHSIPVLGYYGSWQEPPMTDTSYIDFKQKTGHTPYITYNKGTAVRSNVLTVTYEGKRQTANFGGNPVWTDAEYRPERNALTSKTKLNQIHFLPIRSVGATRFTLTRDDGLVLMRLDGGKREGAYIYATDKEAEWRNTDYAIDINYMPNVTVKEGRTITAKLSLASTYTVQKSKRVDWTALPETASLTIPFAIDNTAPEVEAINFDDENRTLTIRAKDNRYVAAIALYSENGMKRLAVTGADLDAELGQASDFVIDLKNVSAKAALVQVYDYAMNVSTYEIDYRIGERAPAQAYMYDVHRSEWLELYAVDGLKNYYHQPVAKTDVVYSGGAEIDGYILATSTDGLLYVVDYEDFEHPICVGNVGVAMNDMAYDDGNKILYGIFDDENGTYLTEIDPFTAELKIVGKIGGEDCTERFGAIEFSNNGCFYAITRAGAYESMKQYSRMYTFERSDITKLTVVINTMEECYGEFAMSEDYASGSLFWMSNPDGLNGNLERYNVVDQQLCTFEDVTDVGEEELTQIAASVMVFCNPNATGEWAAPVQRFDSMELNYESITLLEKDTIRLEKILHPWNTVDRRVVWTSDNESVASVDANGVVTALRGGVATITATSMANANISASCEVIVSKNDLTVTGVLRDKEGKAYDFVWDMEHNAKWEAICPHKVDFTTSSRVVGDEGRFFYQLDHDGYMHLADFETGESVEKSEFTANVKIQGFDHAVMSDMLDNVDEPMLIGFSGRKLYRSYGLENDFVEIGDLTEFMYINAPKATCITSMMWLTYDEQKYYFGTYYYDVFFLMLDDGTIIYFYYLDNEKPYLMYVEVLTDLDLAFPMEDDNPYCSMVYGSDGNVYMAYFDGSSTDLYRMVDNASEGASTFMYHATKIATFGDGVYPVSLLSAYPNSTTQTEKPADGRLTALTQKEPQKRSLVDATDAIIVDVTARDETGVNVVAENGLYVVSYDADKLTLVDYEIKAQYAAMNLQNGEIRFAFVDCDGIAAGKSIATLRFEAKEDSTMTVVGCEVNTAKGMEETLKVGATAAYAGFTDVKAGAWYASAVDYALRNGLFAGMSATTFAPNTNTNRAMFVSVLWRLAGQPEAKKAASFVDVKQSDYYAKAVAWANENDICYGTDATHFSPKGLVTREQAAAFLYRYATKYDYDMTADADLEAFPDAAKVQPYAKQALTWAVAHGLIAGNAKNGVAYIDPRGNATRAQVARILMVFNQNLCR